MHNRIAIIIICIILVAVILAGTVVMLITPNSETENDTKTLKTTTPNEDKELDCTSDNLYDDIRQPDLTSPLEGHKPVPDLNDGNEIYLDMDVVAKLQEIEDAGDDDLVNMILDTMFLLINEFVEREYSVLAVSQIQRFYFSYRSEIGNMEFSELCNKIGVCVESDGVNTNTFASKVEINFGFGANTDFSYIYNAEVVA